MNYESIQEINAELATIPVKGKEYIPVNQRVIAFRKLFPEGSITTELLHFGEGLCVVKATVLDGDRVIATGLAYEREGSTFINKTSFLEVCETSAVGRAIGFVGIGIEGGIASAEEVENATINSAEDKDVKKLMQEIRALALNFESDPALRDARVDKFVAQLFPGKRMETLSAPELAAVKIRLAQQVAALPKHETPGIKTVRIGNQTVEVIN